MTDLTPRTPPRFFARIKPTHFTRLGVCVLLLSLMIGMLAIVFTNNLYYLITATLLAFISTSGVLAETDLSGLEARRSFPAALFAGSDALHEIRLVNTKARFPSFALFVHEGSDGAFGADRAFVTTLRGGGSATVTYLVNHPRRGRHTLEGIWVSTVFPLGITEKATYLPCRAEILVYPRPLPGLCPAPGPATVSGSFESSRRGDGETLASLCDYRPGIPARHIHWPATARTGTLMVKELEESTEEALLIVLMPGLRDSLERALSLVTHLCLERCRRGAPTGLLSAMGVILQGTGEEHLARLLTHLAVHDDPAGSWSPPLADFAGTALLLVHAPGEAPPADLLPEVACHPVEALP